MKKKFLTSGKAPPLLALLALSAVLLLGVALALAQPQALDIAWWTVDGGGELSAGGDYTLTGAFGQPDAGELSGGTFSLSGGFWGSSEQITITDTTPPAAITDLVASTSSGPGSVDLGWTATGDDGITGTAFAYVVRYHTQPITGTNWSSATDVAGEPAPQAAGTAQGMSVGGLVPGRTYYFAIQAADEGNNLSALSNSPSAAASPFCGTVLADTTWTQSASPYVLTCDVTIAEGVTVTVEPGVVLKFDNPDRRLDVNGTLLAVGTSVNPIVFTSYKDDTHGNDTNGDGSASSPMAGDWLGIYFNPSSRGSLLEHAWIGYAGNSYYHLPALSISTGDVAIRYSAVRDSASQGIYLERSFGAEISACDVRSNGGYPLALNNSLPALSSNTFENGQVVAITSDITGTGTLSVPGQWDNGSAAPYYLDHIMTKVYNDAWPITLTIEAGVEVRGSEWRSWLNCGASSLHVGQNAALRIAGTAGQPVTFTRAGETDRWGHLVVEANARASETVIEHAVLEYGDARYHNPGGDCSYFYGEALEIYGGSPTISNTAILSSTYNGMTLWGQANPTISEAQFRYHGERGVDIQEYANATIVNSDLRGNGVQAIRFSGGHVPSLSGNTFGDDQVIGFDTDITQTASLPLPGWRDNGTVAPYVLGRWDTVVSSTHPITLTIAPGVEIRGGQDTHESTCNASKLEIGRNAALVAVGTLAQPITFTSVTTDTWWGYLALGEDSRAFDSRIEHAVFERGGAAWRAPYCNRDYLGSLRVHGGSPIISGTVFQNAGSSGVYVDNATPTLQNNTIVNNANAGVYATNGARPLLRANVLAGNAQYGVQNADLATTVDALGNWWGAPSGPQHPTLNPGGEGNPVSDNVLFDPWMGQPKGEMPTGDLLLSLTGPGTVSPGQSVQYAVYYANMTTQTLENALMMLALPYSAEYVNSTGGGVFWPERQQVFWKLGDLAPGDSGQLAVGLRFLWGLPGDLRDAATVLLGGSNLPGCLFDVTPYLAYVPREILGEASLSQAQVNAERSSYPDLDTLYSQALGDGFVFGAASRLAASTGAVITQVVLLQPDQHAVMYVRRQGSQVRASTFGPTLYAVRDARGGMEWDLQLNRVDYWGSWAPAASLLSARAPGGLLASGECFFNCINEHLPAWVVTNKIKAIGVIVDAGECYDCIQGDSSACADCGAALSGVPGVGESIDTLRCGSDCLADPDSHICTEDKISCEGSSLFSWMGSNSYKIVRCRNGHYDSLPGYVPCTYGDKCVEGKGCVDCAEQPSVCKQQTTRIHVALDPNAKYGPGADLLPGQRLTYTITYENEGDGTAYGVFVADELSQHLDESSLVLDAGGKFLTGTRILVWQVGDLSPKGQAGSKGQLSFSVRLKDDLPGGTVIVNQAVVHFPSVPEKTPTNPVVNVVHPVVALPQHLETEAGQVLAIRLQGLDVGGAPLSYAILDEPLHGELAGIAPQLSYTPASTFSGLDRLSFRASNGVTDSRPAEVNIRVLPWPGDTAAPEVWWVRPEDGAVISDVLASPVLSDTAGPVYAPFLLAQFSEVISATTLTASTVQVMDNSGHTLAIGVKYDETVNQAIILLREALGRDRQYTVSLAHGIEDMAGNGLAAGYTWRFSTGQIEPPGYSIYLPVVIRQS
ncbi:MAG: right-handed parallel beta-helix repeat-containing protein [Thermoflexales bacterium]|nr:right-handed parallel beta-helix repeat-containing protein [Thermoflexales bacterium]